MLGLVVVWSQRGGVWLEQSLEKRKWRVTVREIYQMPTIEVLNETQNCNGTKGEDDGLEMFE